MQLEYELAEKETGVFMIFDLSGRKVKELNLLTGKHIMEVNGTELETGIYYYKVIINENVVKSDKLMIIK